ncbi:MAG: T9SS type A sorting domain-containing protein [Cytophagales bacterium]
MTRSITKIFLLTTAGLFLMFSVIAGTNKTNNSSSQQNNWQTSKKLILSSQAKANAISNVPISIEAAPGVQMPVKVKGQGFNKAPFDIDLQWAVGDTTGGVSLTGVAFTGTEFWISQWNSDSLRTLNANGTFASSFTVPGVTGTRALTWDGTNIYAGGAGQAIYEINPTTKTLSSTISMSGTVGARMCAYDPNADSGNGGFWIGNFTSNIQLISRAGAVLTTITQATHGITGIYGGAVDTFTAGGPYLLVYAQDGPSQNTIHWIDLNTNTPTGVTYDVNPDVPVAGIAGGLFVADGIVTGEQHILAMTQNAAGTLTGYELGLPPPPAAPVNDTLCGAIELTIGPGSTTGDNSLATADTLEPIGTCWSDGTGSGAVEASIWYYFVAPADSNYIVTTDLNPGTNNDTQLTGYTSSGGCTGTLTEVACNDDINVGSGNFLSEMTVPALNGDTIWIQVDGWAGTLGTFDIDVLYDNPPTGSVSRDFEAYSAGTLIVAADDEWEFWPGATLDAPVSTAQANSGTNSLLIDGAPNQDLVFKLGDQTSGTWGVGFSMYIATGNGAYYNLQETEVPGVRWPIGNVEFDPGGTGTIDLVAPSATFTYPHDQWFDVRNYVDLDNDSFQVWIDNSLVLSGAWTSNGGTTQLGGINIYPQGDAGNPPAQQVYYLDDMYFQPDSLRTPISYSFSPFNLTSPPDQTRLEVEAGNATPVVIDWDATTVTPSATPMYNWYLDVQGGTFANPLLDYASDNGGMDSQLTLTSGALDTELANLGIPPGDSVDVIWTVEASVLGQGAFAANGPFDIRLVRIDNTSLDASAIARNVSFYPNPTEGQLIVKVRENVVNAVIIQSMIGQSLKSFEINSTTNVLDLSDLSNGMYIIRFVSDSEEYSQKIIIE